MSDAGSDTITVSTDAVTVRKTLDDDTFQTPAVVLDVRTESETPRRISVSDTIPDAIDLDDVGFHPEYGADHWSIRDREVVFERELEPNEECRTIYGVRDVGMEELEQLFVEPTVESLDDPTEELSDVSDLVSEEDNRAVRELVDGERDSLAEDAPADASAAESDVAPGDGTATAAGDSPLAEEPTTPDPESPLSEESASGAVESPLAEDSTSTDADSPLSEEPVVDEGPEPADDPLESSASAESPLAEESQSVADETAPVEEGAATDDSSPAGDPTPSDADDSIPAAETGAADDESGAVADTETTAEPGAEPDTDSADELSPDADRRIDATEIPAGGVARVLAKELRDGNVSESDRQLLREELADTVGSTEARIEHLQGEVADLAAYTDALEAFLDEEGTAERAFDELRAEIADVRERVNELVTETDDLDARVDDVDTKTGRVSDDVDSLAEEVSGVDADVDDLYDGLGSAEDDLDQVKDRVGSNATDVDDLREEVSALSDDVAEIDANRLTVEELSDRVEDLDESLAGLRQDVEEMAEFRDRLSSAFGTGGAPGSGNHPESNDGDSQEADEE